MTASIKNVKVYDNIVPFTSINSDEQPLKVRAQDVNICNLKRWDYLEPADPSHPYLVKAGIKPNGMKQFEVGGETLLVVPAYDDKGKPSNGILIDAAGGMRQLHSVGGMFGAGTLDRHSTQTVWVCLDPATACMMHETTGHPAIAIPEASYMKDNVIDLKLVAPKAKPVLLLNDDVESRKAGQELKQLGHPILFPEVGPELPSNVVSFNQLAQHTSAAKVVAGIQNALKCTDSEATPRDLRIDALLSSPPQRWRVNGVLPETGLATIYGPSGSGKSFLALDLACSVVQGKDWFGHKTKSSPVYYLCLEDQAGLRDRMSAYCKLYDQKALANIHFHVGYVDLLGDSVDGLVQYAKSNGLVRPVVIIDTLNCASGGADENSSKDMGRILASCRILQAELDGLVVLVHHSGKDSSRGMRGHSSLHAAMDAVIRVSRGGTDVREWSVDKAKNGVDGAKHSFVLRSVVVGNDEDGQELTSCTVAQVKYDPTIHGKKDPSRSEESTPGNGDQCKVLGFVAKELKAGRKHTTYSLMLTYRQIGLGRNAVEKTVKALVASGKLVNYPLPPAEQKGQKKEYLKPV